MPLGRVREHGTFRALQRNGARGRSGPLTVIALVDTESGATGVRAAFAVGRRVGPAVIRNRIRRRLRAILREIDLAPGAYLVIAGSTAATTPYEELRAHAARAAAAAGAGGAR
ncbi:MAG TPA: ribonuclease P protein component [Acidimicrobiales bacterium]